MLIQIVRSTVAAIDGAPRIVDPGDVIDVEPSIAYALIATGRATPPETIPEGGILQTPEDALVIETRTGPRRPRKNQEA